MKKCLYCKNEIKDKHVKDVCRSCAVIKTTLNHIQNSLFNMDKLNDKSIKYWKAQFDQMLEPIVY